MKDLAKHIIKKYKEGGKVEEYKSDLMKEVEGMGPEGKRYLKDKLEGKEYKGELKDEYKHDLDKELEGMSEKGKEDLKKVLGIEEDKDPWKDFKEEFNDKKKDKKEESIGELMAYSEEGYAKGGVVHKPVKVTPQDVLKTKKDKNWIQGAVKKPGALRAEAKKEKLIKGDEKLSAKDLSKLASKAKKGKNALLMKRVNLAKVFAKMRK